MQNCNSKFKIEIKKRAFLYALEIIKFIDQLNKHDLSVQVIQRKQILTGAFERFWESQKRINQQPAFRNHRVG
jgi:hypothetical protein